jgi:hypothetical protein
MMNNPYLKNLFTFCKDKNKFIFEVCNIFGDRLSVNELEFWMIENLISTCYVNDINIKGLSYEEASEKLSKHIEKKKADAKTRTPVRKAGKGRRR